MRPSRRDRCSGCCRIMSASRSTCTPCCRPASSSRPRCAVFWMRWKPMAAVADWRTHLEILDLRGQSLTSESILDLRGNRLARADFLMVGQPIDPAEPKEGPMTDINNIARDYIDLWNERMPSRRREIL